MEQLPTSPLLMQTCDECGRAWRTPFEGCPYCGGERITPRLSRGRGHVYSWVETHRSFDGDPTRALPYVVVAVDLDEGARIFGRYGADRVPMAGERVEAQDPGPETHTAWFEPAATSETP